MTDSTNSKVFVTKFQPDWDFSPAADYGDVVFLTENEHMPEPTSAAYNDRVTHEIMNGMDSYVAGLDYVVITAAAIPNMVVAMVLGKSYGPHNILRWNNKKKHYDLFKINGKI